MNIINQAKEIRRQTEVASQHLPDEDALKSLSLFPLWSDYIGKEVATTFRVQYQHVLYECITAHTPLEDWTPDATPALWKRVSIEEWPEWVRPTGSHTAYMKGAKVIFATKDGYDGQKRISAIDNNIWDYIEYPIGWDLANI